MRNMAVLVNEGAGSVTGQSPSQLAAGLRAEFSRHGIETEPLVVKGPDLNDAIERALGRGVEAMIVGGGDGTLGSAAARLAYRRVPFGALPVGTYNHFSRDLGMPMELPAAVAAIAHGRVQRIDLGEVNGHFFINASSIGAYPRAVSERERLRRERGWTKHLAMTWAAAKVLLSRPNVHTRLEIDGRQLPPRHTPFVFVGNNTYSLGVRPGELKSSLDTGVLRVFAARCSGARCLAKLSWKAFRNQLMEAEELEEWSAKSVCIRTRKPRVRVALDGEVVRLEQPLNYRIHAGALEVIRPVDG